MTLRQRLFNVATNDELDAYARNQGFPSYAALQALTRLGAHLSQGNKITPAHAAEVKKAYPSIPSQIIDAYAKQINSKPDPQARVDSLISHVAGPDALRAGRQLVDNFTTAQISAKISERVDTARPRNDFSQIAPKPPSPSPSPSQHERTLRDEIINAIPKSSAERTLERASNYPHIRRNFLADKLEQAGARNTEVAKDPNASVRDAVEAAYDSSALRDMAKEELAATDISNVVEGEYDAQS